MHAASGNVNALNGYFIIYLLRRTLGGLGGEEDGRHF
jgi:hypothetical protein